MALYSYIVKHDTGFAPNPFFGYCTLACCILTGFADFVSELMRTVQGVIRT